MSIAFHDDHFRKFASIDGKTQWVASRKPRSWATSVGADSEICSALPDEKIDRAYLKKICANSNFSAEQCVLAIMAWGGMKVDHGRATWAVRENWVEIVEALRAGELTRLHGYDKFWRFRKENPRCGIGPAFYTKIIFFADPRHDGYIMDQWTALSVNLLTSVGPTDAIAMTSGVSGGRRYHRVADSNTADTYELFCKTIEQIGQKLKLPSEVVEERLFSWGGRKPGEWRSYVKNWSQSDRQ